VRNPAARTVEDHQAAGIARLAGMLGDALGGQVELEVSSLDGRILKAGLPDARARGARGVPDNTPYAVVLSGGFTWPERNPTM